MVSIGVFYPLQFILTHIGRFGGEMVTVGTEVLMLGGKERNPDIYLDSIEQFDTKTRYSFCMVLNTISRRLVEKKITSI